MSRLHSHSGTHSHAAPETTGGTIHWARFYDLTVKLLATGQDRKLREATITLAALQSGEKVLDVGCGTGDLTLAAKRRVGPTGQVVGIDAAVEMIEVAQSKAAKSNLAIQFQAEAIERLSFADNTFDVVLSSLMMHHLPGDLKQKGLREVYRVLKPGGRIVIVDFAGASPSAPWLTRLAAAHMNHDNIFERLPGLVQDAGFTQLKSGEAALGVVGFVAAQKPTER